MTSVDEKKALLPLEARAILSISEFKAPRTTQDTVDKQAAEYATANYLRQQAEKRYEAAKSAIVDTQERQIEQLRTKATDDMQKTVVDVVGEDWSLRLAANKPATRVDAQDLRTELIKRGVAVSIIDAAINKVTKKATPALVITAMRVME